VSPAMHTLTSAAQLCSPTAEQTGVFSLSLRGSVRSLSCALTLCSEVEASRVAAVVAAAAVAAASDDV
jgi:hypothetical protein